MKTYPRKNIKNKHQVDFGSPDYYKSYLEDVKFKAFQSAFGGNTNMIVSNGDFYNIQKKFNQALIKKILETGEMIKLPYNFGSLGVKKKKINYGAKNLLRIDWQHFRKTGVKLKHTNDHSNGYYYRFYWERPKNSIPTKNFYMFKPARSIKRLLSNMLMSNKADFPEKIKNPLNREEYYSYLNMLKKDKNASIQTDLK